MSADHPTQSAASAPVSNGDQFTALREAYEAEITLWKTRLSDSERAREAAEREKPAAWGILLDDDEHLISAARDQDDAQRLVDVIHPSRNPRIIPLYRRVASRESRHIQALAAAERARQDAERTRDAYATAARVIHLHLGEFCNEELLPDEMIADASRRAAAALAASREEVKRLKADGERLDWLEANRCDLDRSGIPACPGWDVYNRDGLPACNTGETWLTARDAIDAARLSSLPAASPSASAAGSELEREIL